MHAQRSTISLMDSPVGPLWARLGADGLIALEFRDVLDAPGLGPTHVAHGDMDPPATHGPLLTLLQSELADFFAGRLTAFSIPLAPRGTAFQQQVWNALQTIPPGQTRSYADVARMIGRPTAVRAVARANATNPIAILIPCHRVIGSDGSLTGYGGGLDRKRRLLDHERRFLLDSPGSAEPGSLFADTPHDALAARR